MAYDFNAPNYWLDRAEEMRTQIDLMGEPGNREIILRVTSEYERLGRRARARQDRRERRFVGRRLKEEQTALEQLAEHNPQ